MIFLPFALTASTAEQPNATLVFASDYIYDQSLSTGQSSTALSGILDQIYSVGNSVDQAVFCGDYTSGSTNSNYNADATAAISEIDGTVDSSLGTNVATMFLQGEKDSWNASLMAATGAYEFDDYILYIINTEGYNPSEQGSYSSESTVQATANALNTYLQGLIASGDPRPVFIATHVPLHMSSRTSSRYTTGDNMYASHLFSIINQAAQQLDIIYLYGHNNEDGWDSYLGGSVNYLPVGSSIYVPNASGVTTAYTDQFTAQTLNFTYMNAGYLGYGDGSTADSTLTASVFEIYDDHVEISRYSADGLYQVGAAGSYNTVANNGAYDDSYGFTYEGTTHTYLCTATATESPQNVERINEQSYPVSLAISGDVATAKVGNAGTLTTSLTNATAISYTWTSTDASVAKIVGSGAGVAVEYNKSGTATVSCTAIYDNGSGNQSVTDTYQVTVSSVDSYHSVTTYTLSSAPSSSGTYVISTGNGQALTYNGSFSVTAGTISGVNWNPPSGLTDTSPVLWTVTKTGSNYYIRPTASGQTSKYLSVKTSLSCTGSVTATSLIASSNGYKLYGSRYLRYNNGSFSTTTSSTSGTVMYLYQVGTDTVQDDASAAIVDGSGDDPAGTYNLGDTLNLFADVTNISQITGYSWTTSDSSVATVANATSASPSIHFVGKGSATIGLTVTHSNGAVTTSSGTLSVENQKTYQRITSLNEIVSGENYLIVWPLGDSSSTSYHMVSRTAMSTSGAVGLKPAALSKDVGDTFTADCTDYEWQFSQSNGYWKVGDSAGGYMALGNNSLVLNSTGSNCNITVTNSGAGYTAGPYFQITATNGYSLDRFSPTAEVFSGYAGGTNRYCYLYKIVTEETPDIEDATSDIFLDDAVVTNTTQYLYSVASGDRQTLVAQYDHLSNATVSWSSSDPTVATINASGVITAKGHSGEVTFTMKVTGTNEAGQAETLIKSVTFVIATNAQVTTVEIQKHDAEDHPLAGAGFMLYSNRDCSNVANVYLDSAKTVDLASAETTDVLTNEDGLLGFYGLSPGTYYLREIYAPTGYELLNDTITITIDEDQTVTVADADNAYQPVVTDGVIRIALTDQNMELNMPEAGQSGIYRYIVAGAALMVLAALLIIAIIGRRRGSAV